MDNTVNTCAAKRRGMLPSAVVRSQVVKAISGVSVLWKHHAASLARNASWTAAATADRASVPLLPDEVLHLRRSPKPQSKNLLPKLTC